MRMLIIFDPITDDLQRLVSTNSFNSPQRLQLDIPVDILDVPEVPAVPGDVDQDTAAGFIPGAELETGRDALLTPSGILDFTNGFIYGTDLVKNTTYLD